MPSPLDGPLIVLTLLVTHTAAFGLGWLKGITALKRRWYGEEPATSAAPPPPAPTEVGSADLNLDNALRLLKQRTGVVSFDTYDRAALCRDLSRLRAAAGERT